MNLIDAKINNGFWKERKELNKSVSLYAVLKTFQDSGRIRALTGDNDPVKEKPHIYWESDLAKLMEGAFFSMQQEKDEKLEKICDSIIDKIISNQEDDGYLNYFFTRHEPENKFTNLRDRHELYCAGHLLESSIEHHKATGNSKFFDAMEKYVDHIISKFGREEGKMRGYPGHQEIELALVKAYEHTNKQKFLDLATYFIDERGTHNNISDNYFINERKILEEKEKDFDPSKLPSWLRDVINYISHGDLQGKVFRNLEYWQAHARPVDQKTAEGHSVRALYMFTAMADLARLNNDSEMLTACKTLWRNIIDKRMYVHSGVGSAHIGERFTDNYDLPNDMAYAETCATIALIYFANRMSKIELNSEFGDIIENSLYNLLLASTSLDGKCFFYDNYLECDPVYLHAQQRRHGIRDEYHRTSCCPSNITRLFASMDMYIYNAYEDSLVVDQYISSEFNSKNQGIKLNQTSDFPHKGYSKIEIIDSLNKDSTIYFRIPSWDKNMQINLNGSKVDYEVVNGYAKINKSWQKGDIIEFGVCNGNNLISF